MGTLTKDFLTALAKINQGLDELVASDYLPGYVAGIKHAGVTRILVGGYADLATGTPMRPDTQFRLASMSKPWAAVLTMRLVEQGVLSVDSPITEWLPEFDQARVLTDPTAVVPDGQEPPTVPAEPITVGHLLTQTSGYGLINAETGQAQHRIADAMERSGIVPWVEAPELTADDVAARFAELPLCFQPGTSWLYHSSSDLLSILLERAAGPLDGQIAALCQTLGLHSTGFVADPKRLATAYRATEKDKSHTEMVVTDSAVGRYTHPPRFNSLAGGMVSTAEDYVTFLNSLAGNRSTLISEESLVQLRADQLTPPVRQSAGGFLERGCSYGYQVQVQIEPDGLGEVGRFGWGGGTGTVGFADPASDLIAVLLTQREMGSPQDTKAFEVFEQGLYGD